MAALGDSLYYPLGLNLMAVSAVENIGTSGKNEVTFEPIQSGERLRWVPCAQVARDEDSAWEVLTGGQFDPASKVIVEEKRTASTPNCQNTRERADIQITNEHSNQLKIRVQTPSPGWLVLSDVWYPGWRAHVDGDTSLIWRANYLFRAVRLEGGEHEVVFSYTPWSFYLGSITSLMAAIILWLVFRMGR
jgi:hypothetical protein